MKELTDKQKNILKIIFDHIAIHGFPPTIREIGIFSKTRTEKAVYDHVLALRKKGFLTWTPKKARTFKVLKLEK